MEKLTMEYLAVYLPFNLKITFEADEHEHLLVGLEDRKDGIILISPFDDYGCADWDKAKPILNPLSAYTDINGKAMVELNCDLPTQMELNELANGYISPYNLTLRTAQICFKNHIDIFWLIDKGLAVEKETA